MWIILKDDKLANKFNFGSKRIINLNKLNILIGANNSGKSYFLRELMKSEFVVYDKSDISSLIETSINRIMYAIDMPVSIFENLDFKFRTDDLIKYLKIKDLGKYLDYKSTNRSIYGQTQYNIGNKENRDEYLKIINNMNEELKLNLEIPNKLDNFGNRTNDMNLIRFFTSDINKAVLGWYKNELIIHLLNQTDNFEKMEDLFFLENNIVEAKELLKKVFIPISRTLRHPDKEASTISPENLLVYKNDIYKKRIISEYEIKDKDIDVFTGLDLYDRYKSSLLGTNAERKLIIEFELFLSNYFFESKTVSIIPNETTYELHISIDNKESIPLYKVGDGISSIIIILYNLFLTKSRIYFIEEPEQNLHPGFQRLLIDLLVKESRFKDKFFFITTHSNHLIDYTNYSNHRTIFDISTKEDKINIKKIDEGNTEILKTLGVLPSSVFLANKVIWVEGKYDAIYIRALLEKKYKEKDNNDKLVNERYIEGVDYVFIPYAGSNRTLFDFNMYESVEVALKERLDETLKAIHITNDSILIMDSDGNKKKTTNFFNKIDKEKISVFKLSAWEIENIVPENVLKKYAISEVKEEINITYRNKKYNTDDVKTYLESKVKENEYKNRKINDYLNELIINEFGKNNIRKILGTKEGFKVNGTLKNKAKLSSYFAEYCNNENNNIFTKSSLELLEFVYDFISK